MAAAEKEMADEKASLSFSVAYAIYVSCAAICVNGWRERMAQMDGVNLRVKQR